MACEPHFAEGHDLSALKVIGSVGEPINEEAWQWYHDVIGGGRCALVDTWWQTETGGILISGLGAHSPMKPAHAGLPLPGIEPVLVDGDGNTVDGEAEGYLCIARPWPSMIRTTYGDHERCRNVYFSAFKGKYFTGDGARRDADGMFRIIGRVDDVVNVSGHRFGTAEIEDAIDSHPAVAESAVIGSAPIKGQAVHAYVILKEGTLPDTAEGIAALRKEIGVQVSTEIGNIARPDRIQFTPGLPKTRSGKICAASSARWPAANTPARRHLAARPGRRRPGRRRRRIPHLTSTTSQNRKRGRSPLFVSPNGPAITRRTCRSCRAPRACLPRRSCRRR